MEPECLRSRDAERILARHQCTCRRFICININSCPRAEQSTVTTFFSNPHEYTLAEVLAHFGPLLIPRYQRGYSWESEEVAEFIEDFNDVVKGLRGPREQPHFMGTVLFIQRATRRRHREFDHEIVDGQQRLTTFSLLLVALRNAYLEIADTADSKARLRSLREAQKIDDEFLTWKNDENKVGQRLTPSQANAEYFTSIVLRSDSESFDELTRRARVKQVHDSNKKLQAALRQLDEEFVRAHLERARSVNAKLKTLDDLLLAITARARLLVLRTASQGVGYELFAVINNRGRPLSEADLVRTRFIEEAERLKAGLPPQLGKLLEDTWGSLLQEGPEYSIDLLHAIWTIRKGSRWSSSRFVGEFTTEFLPSRSDTSRAAHRMIVDGHALLAEAHERYSRIVDGKWPYEDGVVSEWYQQRLFLIVKSLGHKQSLPLLLAAAMSCDEKTFAKLVFELDRFLFRYVAICKGHASRLGDALFKAAKVVRHAEGKSAVTEMKRILSPLRTNYAPEAEFRRGVGELKYSNRTQRIIKYMLLTLDAYREEYAKKRYEVPFDQAVTVSYDDCWVEHIYPQEPQSAHRKPQLDALKHDLGNLTLGDEKGQRKAGNKPFARKRSWYRNSGIADTAAIGRLKSWGAKEIEARRRDLLERAAKVWLAS